VSRRPPALITGLRWTRGLLLGLSMILLTSIAHAAGDGQLPDAGAFVLMLPLCTALGVATMNRPRGWMWFTCYAVGVQALLHVLLVTMSAHGGHLGAVVPAPGMLLTHLIAAAALGLLLAFGDSLLLRWLAYMRSALLSRTLVVAPIAAPRLGPPDSAASAPAMTFVHDIARRGPPVRCR